MSAADIWQIHGETISSVGGWIDPGVRVSWLSPRRRYVPAHCYVLRSGGRALILDGGLGIHRDRIRAGLSALLAGYDDRHMLLLRREPDAIANLPWIAREFGIRTVSSGGGTNPLDFFEMVDHLSSAAQIRIMSGLTATDVVPGDTVACGDLRIDVLRTNFRILTTNWLYEHATRTLFCADSWGMLDQPGPRGPALLAAGAADLAPERIADHFAQKFDWLIGTNPDLLIAELRELFTKYRIERVCPSFGCVIEGEAATGLLLERTVIALQQLEAMPRADVLAGIDWREIAGRVPGLHAAEAAE